MAGKATELASYYVSISANTKGLSRDITSQVTKDMDGALNRVEKQAAKRSSGIGKKLASGMGKTLKGGALVAGAAVGGTLAKAIHGGFGRLKSIEQAEAQLKGLGHSGTEVAAIMKDANAAVKGTAFSMGDAAGVAAQMTAAGIQPGKDLTRILGLVGDTAANTGEDLKVIGSIWGKVAAKGKLDGETLAQIQDRNIGLTSALAKEYGVTAEEATKMVSQGKVSFEDFARVMEKTVGGSALIAGATFSGALANVNAAIGRLGAALIGPIFASGPSIFGKLNEAIDNTTTAVEPLATKFGEWLAPQLERLAAKAVELSEKLPGIIEGFQNGDTEGAAGTLRSLADGARDLAAAAEAAGPALAQIGASSFGISMQLLASTLEAISPLLQGIVIPALGDLSSFLSENEWAAKLLGAALVGAFVVPKVSSGISSISGSLKSMSGTITNAKSSWSSFTTLMSDGSMSKGQAATKALSENFPKMSGAINGASKAFTGLKASMMAHPLMWIAAAIAAVVAGLIWFFTKTETGKEIWESFSAKVKEVWEEHLQPIFDSLKEKAGEVFGWMADVLWPKVMGIWNALGEVVSWLWNTILNPIWTIIKYAWTALVLALFSAWEFILKPAWNAIAAVMQWLWNTVLLPIWNALKAAWNGLMMAMKWVWETILKPAWDAIKNAFLTLWNNHLKPAFDSMKAKWDEVIGKIKEIWETKLKPAWDAMKQKIQEVIDTYVRPAIDRMKEAFQKAKDKVEAVVNGIKEVWNKLKNILAKPINFMIRSVWNNGILKVWRKAKTFLPVAEPPADMATIPEFARGGAIYGPGTGTSDSIVARLSHGEHVLTAKEVKALGGHAGVEMLRKAALSGQEIGSIANRLASKADGRKGDIGGMLAFASGGPVIMDKSSMKKEEPAWMAKVDKGHAWAKALHGQPYVWGGSSHAGGGSDCCLVGDTMVYGPNGARRMDEIKAGEQVYSYVDGKLTTETVTAAWFSKTQDVYRVRTRNKAVLASDNHPFMRLVEVDNGTGSLPSTWDIEWARTDELRPGDLLITPKELRLNGNSNTLPSGREITKEQAWVLGLIVGDGSVGDKNVAICVYGDVRERATAAMLSLGATSVTHTKTNGLTAYSTALARELERAGFRGRAVSKRVPDCVWGWDDEHRRAFLDGYCDADGHLCNPETIRKHGQRTYASASRALLEDARALHITLGDAVSNISTNTREGKQLEIKGVKIKNARPIHVFTVWADDARDGLAALRRNSGVRRWMEDGDFEVAKLLEVTHEGVEDTYDIEVDGAHNFIANGIVVHNSGFMSGIADVILGGNGARKWATMDFNPTGGDQTVAGQRWNKGLGPGFSIGVWNGGPAGGHTYGTLGKTNKNPAVNVESGGSPSYVKYGIDAAGADHPQTAKGGAFHLAIGADGDFVSGGSGGPSPEEMIAKIKEKIKDLLDSVMKPIKDNIRSIVGDPTTVIKDIPHKALDMLPTKLLEQLYSLAEKLDDLLSTVYNKAKDLTSWAVPSFLRDSGGPLPTGTSIVQNNTGDREFVLTMEQFKIAQGVLRGIGRTDLADDLGERAGIKSDDRDKSVAAELAESTTGFFANDLATFVGLGGKDNILTNPGKSFAGTVIDMILRPHAYQKDAKTTDAKGGSDDEVSAAATAEAVEAAPASGSSSSGIDEDAARVADYQQGEEGYESSVHMPDVIEGEDPGGSGVERFRKLVKQLLDHYGHPASWVENTLRRMNQESGGNVNAVNKWDVNWQNGVPSVGLMQVTKPAYSDHKDAKFDKGPYEYGVSKNPAANIASSMRYTMARYGSLPAGYDRAGGYRYGGWVRGAGTGTSDSIPARLSNGEFVVNARDAAHNRHLLEAMNAGQLRGSAVSRPVEAITPAAATNAEGAPLVSVGTIQARDEQSAIDKLQRFAHRASRSAALHGGR